MKRVGSVYVVFFTGGLLKVGRTSTNPEERIKCHKSLALRTGNSYEGHFVSDTVLDSVGLETEMVRFCIDNGEQVSGSREWFYGGEDLKRHLIEVVTTAKEVTEEEFRVLVEEEERRLEKIVDFFFPLPQSKPSTEDEWWRSFEESMTLARELERLVLGNLCGGKIFEPVQGYSCSSFALLCSILVHETDPSLLYELFYMATNRTDELMELVLRVSDRL